MRKNRCLINKELLSKLINIVVASSNIEKLFTPDDEEIRSNLHLLIHGSIGSGKSTILKKICDKKKVAFTTGISKASYLGSIDKQTGTFIPPIIWTNRNSIVGIDEFDINTRNPKEIDVTKTLLSLMENPSYMKPMGFRANNFSKTSKGGLYCKVKDSTIYVKTKFSLIVTTMDNIYGFKSNTKRALLTRCICINICPSFDDLINLIKGKKLFDFKEYKVDKVVKISKKDMEIIIKYLSDKHIPDEYFLRTVGDFYRIFAVLKNHDYEVYDYIIESRKNMTTTRQ